MAWHQSPRGGDRSSHGERSVESLTRPDRDGIPPSGNLYGVPANPLCDDGADKALRLMLRDVRFDVRSGTLVVTNRATGAVIFSGSVKDLAHGTFTAGNMPPPGPGYAAGADSGGIIVGTQHSADPTAAKASPISPRYDDAKGRTLCPVSVAGSAVRAAHLTCGRASDSFDGSLARPCQ